ncbi:MAG TPA: metalloregulator ArsR/SmtB family transcription factor [Candidatus Paceibacterota bacterium]|nr:metalloregulator ArsR/SmtB family transcription factor [Candidatus Paceibacterota bacterium]
MSDLCNEIQKFGKGIGNASRYRIVEALFGGPKTVNQLVRSVHLTQPAVSQHLKTLKACEIVKDERHGQEVLYELNTRYVLGLLKALSSDVGRKRKSKNKLIT